MLAFGMVRMSELRDIFREGVGAQIEALEMARDSIQLPESEDTIRRVAHSLKGSGASYGFPEVTEAAASVENAPPGELLARLADLLILLHGIVNGEPEALVLVIDDDPLIRRLLELKLEAPHRHVIGAGTVADAQQVLTTRDVSLIMLDLFLPDGDGRTLLMQLRAQPGTATVPIVVMSGNDSALAKAECVALGADGYIEKPFDPDGVAALVVAALRRRFHESRHDGIDPVTGLPEHGAAAEAFRAARSASKVVAVAVLEVECHGADDPNVAAQAMRLAATVLGEMVGDRATVARWSESELLVMFPGRPAATAHEPLEKTRLELRTRPLVPEGGNPLLVTFSGAIVDGGDRETLGEAAAETATLLQQARMQGGDRVLLAPPEREGDGRRILLAEDDSLTASLIIHRLEREGFEVLHYPDGESALAAATGQRIALAILDVKMPRMDGFELLGRLRELSQFAATPIILLTAMGGERDVVRGFELGADDYILKPFSPAELTVRVHRLLERA